jgi:hypothetical protein
MLQFDRKRLIGEMVSRYGIRLDDDDPALAIITLNQLALEETIQGIGEQLRARISEFEMSTEKIEVRAGAAIAQQVKESTANIRKELHADIYAASLKARDLMHQIHEAHRRPVILRWVAIGLVFGFILFLCGVWAGRTAALGFGRAGF